MLLAPAAGEKPGGPAGLFRTPFLESCPAKTPASRKRQLLMQGREAFRWRPLRLLREAEEAVRKTVFRGAMLSCGSAPERAAFCPRSVHLPGKGRTSQAFAAAAVKSTGRPRAARPCAQSGAYAARALPAHCFPKEGGHACTGKAAASKSRAKGRAARFGVLFFCGGAYAAAGPLPVFTKDKGEVTCSRI